MSEEPSAIPLADVLRAANDLVAAGLIEDYALGGALAAIYYVEPFATYDADIIFVAAEKGLTAGIPAIYSHLQKRGWRVEREHLLIRGNSSSRPASLQKPSAKRARSNTKASLRKCSGPNTSSPSPPASAGTRIWRALNRCWNKRRSTEHSWTKFCAGII